MPPKRAPTAANGTPNLTQANVYMIRAALCCVEDFKPDWAKVESDFGLSKHNSLRGFRAAIKPLGLDIKDGKVFAIDADDNAAAAAPTAAPTPNGKGKAKRKSPDGDTDGSSEDVKDEVKAEIKDEAKDKPTPKKVKVATKNAPVVKKEPKTEGDDA